MCAPSALQVHFVHPQVSTSGVKHAGTRLQHLVSTRKFMQYHSSISQAFNKTTNQSISLPVVKSSNKIMANRGTRSIYSVCHAGLGSRLKKVVTHSSTAPACFCADQFLYIYGTLAQATPPSLALTFLLDCRCFSVGQSAPFGLRPSCCIPS